MNESPSPNIHKHQFYDMGCNIQVWLECDDADQAKRLLLQAEKKFETAVRRFSRFDPFSELSQINQHAGHWTPVSHDMWCLVERAIWCAHTTGGLFDPTILNAVEAAGYTTSFDTPNFPHTNHLAGSATQLTTRTYPTVTLGGYTEIKRDPFAKAIKFPSHLRLDFGGLAKGYTAQAVVDLLRPFGACLIDAGGDLVAGDAPTGQPGWPVGIAAPSINDSSENMLRLWLQNGALTTSGTDYRNWVINGRPSHHIIDPRTGRPSTGNIVTATVLAHDACTAEAWATAAIVAGDESYEMFYERNIQATLVDKEQFVTVTPALRPAVQWES